MNAKGLAAHLQNVIGSGFIYCRALPPLYKLCELLQL
jgi:hypothetical protein